MTIAKRIEMAENHPLDFTLQYPPRREYFQDHFRGEVNSGEIAAAKEMLLYVHIPFCAAKCYFCNFAVDIRSDPSLHQRYTDLLCEQLKRLNDFLPEETVVPGIDIGGGTPTLLQAAQLRQVLQALAPWRRHTTTDHPLSIETTPAIAARHPDRLDALVEGGISRISMGVQSTNAVTLADVNRKAQENMTGAAIRNLRQAGFRRINTDLIFALPRQTPENWRDDLQAMLEMDIDSITTYDCLYRGKGRALTKRTAEKPTPETYGALYDMAYEMLIKAGFHAAYGSVNFSRHAGETGTSPYFEGRLFEHIPYLGAGNYASSLVGNAWWFAPYGVNQWMKRIEAGDVLPQGDVYILPQEELMAKQILLSLNYGVIDAARFGARFGVPLAEVYREELVYGLNKGWLQQTPEGYGVRPGHFSDMHKIRALFYTDLAIGWLQESSSDIKISQRG